MTNQQPQREIDLHRRVCVIKPDAIDIRPARSAAVVPFIFFVTGIAAALGALFLINTLPFFVIVSMLGLALILVPFAGMGFVYSVYGANVVIDAKKQTAVWQQGFMGMGVGTQELVPFHKIERVEVEDISPPVEDGQRDFAQYDLRILKSSGRRLTLGQLNVPFYLEDDGLERAREVGQAVAALVQKPLVVLNDEDVPSPKRRRRPASTTV